MPTTSELIRRLKKAGFVVVRNGHKHDLYARPGSDEKPIPVSRHKKELANGTYHRILKDAGIED